MSPDATAVEWARRASFTQPLSWGEVEAGILAREPVPESLSGRERLLAGGIGAIGYFFVALFAALTWGAALIGLLLVAWGTRRDPPLGPGWYAASVAAFAMACLVQVNSIRVWFETRARSFANATACGVAALSSGSAYVLLASTDDLPDVQWLDLLVPATCVLGIVAILPLTFSRPEGRAAHRRPPSRGPRQDGLIARYRATRAEVVDVLTHRGLVKLDEADRTRLLEMPLGYWDELDGVSESEWRRILELRLVGWRDFDKSDERRWTPAGSRPV